MARDNYREKILNAAIRVFAERGYRDATIRDICSAADVNVSMVNYYFKNKEGLYSEVVQQLFSFALREDIVIVSNTVTDEETWKSAVRRFVEIFLGYMSVTEAPGVYTARIFRWEITRPSSLCKELQAKYGWKVYSELEKLMTMAIGDDSLKVKLYCGAIWSRMAVLALADEQWLVPFVPKGIDRGHWVKAIADHICGDIFSTLKYKG